MNSIQHLHEIAPRELIPGFAGRIIHTPSMTLVYWDVVAGAELPPHSHFHEQVVNLLIGEFELTINDQCHLLRAGDVIVIPRDANHCGKAMSDCRILDVFQPVREDYK